MSEWLPTLRKCIPNQNQPLISLLDSCKSMKELKQIYAQLVVEGLSGDAFACSKVVAFAAVSPSGCMEYAKNVFKTVHHPNIFTWNSMIRALASGNNPREAISFFSKMLEGGFQPNNFTFPFVVKACTKSLAVDFGISVHTHIVKSGLGGDAYVQSSLIHMYSSFNRLEDAERLFDGSSERDVVSCNAMIDGYVRSGDFSVARSTFDRMGCKDVVSWNTMITGYSNAGLLEEAYGLFVECPKRNVVSWNAMLTGYAKSGDVESARRLFDEMPHRDVVSWNAMIACYSQCNRPNEALLLFDEMQAVHVRATDATLVSILLACAHLGALDQGKRLHSFIDTHKIQVNKIIGTALLDMYAKCGSIEAAIQVFDLIGEKDVLSWNTIIAGLAMHGQVERCHHLFKRMIESGIKPDDITFVTMLSACSHAGMVEDGLWLLDCMSSRFGINPKVEHYGCIIDLLGRAGMFEKAMELISSLPMEPNAGAWGALLGACRIHGNTEVGELAGKRLIDLEPDHSGRYVLLSNIYALGNRWEDARKVRKRMNSRGVSKPPGFSFIEMKGCVHGFVAGGKSHPEYEMVYSMLSEIHQRLRMEEGYLPETKQVLFDVDEEEKEQALFVHSEKLALAFGFLHTDCSSNIRITKNLRFCTDCHNFVKLCSKVYNREIIVRDRNRFHRFILGACSCKDYW